MEETLTLYRLGLPDRLRKNLKSTNLIESALGVAEDVTGTVKRWRGEEMRLRWNTAGLLMAEKQFHRIRDCKLMSKLLAVLDFKDANLAQLPSGRNPGIFRERTERRSR